MIQEYILIISKNIYSRKLRAFLTVLGVIIGVMIIILLFSLGTAMQNGVEEQFGKLGVKSIRIIPGGLFGPPSGSMGLTNDVKDKIEAARGVDYVQPVLNDYTSVGFNNEIKYISIISYDTSLGEKAFLDTDTKIETGRYFTSSDKDSIIVGASVAEKVFKKKITIKETVNVGNRKFKVVGITKKAGTEADNRIYMPLDTARELFNKKDITNIFLVQIKQGYNIEQVAESIRIELMKKYKDKDAFQVFTPEQLLKQIKSILGVVQIVLVAIASISLIVGSIGIMNSMFTSVLERTRDIGLMRAVGATKRDILILFLMESGVIGLIGGFIGIIIGISIAFLVNFIVKLAGIELLSVQVGWQLILFSLFFSMLIGIISGLIPAIRAASLQPVEALRYE